MIRCFFDVDGVLLDFEGSFLKAMTHFLIRDWGCAALPIFVTVVAVYACWIGVVKLASYLGWGGTEIATWKSQSYGAYAAQGAAGTGSAGMGFVFLAVTAASILLADRITKGDLLSPVFFALVLGAWLLKFVVFLVLVFTLREASFVDPVVLFVTLVIAVLGGLVTDLVAVSRGRVPYVSDITLPGSS